MLDNVIFPSGDGRSAYSSGDMERTTVDVEGWSANA